MDSLVVKNDEEINQFIVNLSEQSIIEFEMPLISSLSTLSWPEYRRLLNNKIYQTKMTSWEKLIFTLLVLDTVTCKISNKLFYNLSNIYFEAQMLLKKIRIELTIVLYILCKNDLTSEKWNTFNAIIKRCQNRLTDNTLRSILDFDEDIKKMQATKNTEFETVNMTKSIAIKNFLVKRNTVEHQKTIKPKKRNNKATKVKPISTMMDCFVILERKNDLLKENKSKEENLNVSKSGKPNVNGEKKLRNAFAILMNNRKK